MSSFSHDEINVIIIHISQSAELLAMKVNRHFSHSHVYWIIVIFPKT